MEMFSATFASGWASGINAWATVFVLGILGRFAGVEGIPEGFQRTDVLVIVGVLTLIEVVADKIPYIDSAWDAISTAIRPIVGAVIGALWAGASGNLWMITLAATGGIVALVSHLTKSGLRLVVNTSPEPVTNVAASVGGDVAVTGMATMVALAPIAAAGLAFILLLAGLALLVFLWRRIQAGWLALRRWRRRDDSPAPA